MSILVFGRSGQVATELATSPDVIALGRAACDVTDADAIRAAIESRAPKAIINAAAYTAVDRAEAEPDAAAALNARAPAVMAEVAAARGIPFVHISTDYVFDGSGDAPRAPNAVPRPLNVYGATKQDGEEAVRAAGGPHAILRTSWVFSAHGANFVKTMLRLGAERDALSIVSDQIGGPTPARAIAEACLKIAAQLSDNTELSGTYHVSGAPDVSWADFARAIFEAAGLDCTVTDIPTSAYPTPAARPLNSRLDCAATAEAFGIGRPDWRAHLDLVLKELA
ncbi:dTDP-4-dehydrorhamnose reductase [Roseivivax halotolerans]|uniref:dTDP-4-dehydrorhamnose reductase n=1 Tax=Roseivivax halotolerans TaxID=93684 RepID=A0A1I6A308_9RHOB|nr:dTDP-4-dehydrorhamnose reductase [Roseivivax halotolerans]SFQ62937.1 dTDP-4-dehydrorhamnose reductase [Roseivivax halotolerans]